jgi:two-component system response regulator VanR
MKNHEFILKKQTLLLIEDDIQVREYIYKSLIDFFKCIKLAHTIERGLEIFHEGGIDIIITDIKIPGSSSCDFSLIEQIRYEEIFMPIIILSQLVDSNTLLKAANLHINGYITKPVNFYKLNKSIVSVIKYLENNADSIQLTKNINYLPMQQALIIENNQVNLGKKECQLLDLLIFSKKTVITKDEIIHVIWPEQDITDSALKNLLNELRKKVTHSVIKNQPSKGWYIDLNATV